MQWGAHSRCCGLKKGGVITPTLPFSRDTRPAVSENVGLQRTALCRNQKNRELQELQTAKC